VSSARWSTALLSSALAALSLCIHALPFLLYSHDPLGYDTGFYRRYLIQPFLSFPNAPVPGLGNDAWGPRIFLDTLRLVHMPADVALYGGYIFLYALLPVLLFLYLRRSMGKGGAFLAGIFVTFSSVAYQAYWYMFFKNIFALDLMIMAFIALEKRRTYLACALDIAIALSHATSAVVYMITLLALVFFEPRRWREWALHLSLTGASFVLVNVALLREASITLPTALFIEWPQFVWLSLPFLLLLAASWRTFSYRSVSPTLTAFAIATLLYPILHLPFYQRVFVYADIALASFAAYAGHMLLNTIRISGLHNTLAYARFVTLCVALGLIFGNFYDQVRSLRPLMTEASIIRIEAISAIVPPDATVLTSANEAPWYEGWTATHIAAPGLLHDSHNLTEWEALWDATSTALRVKFLSSFKGPLYISTLGSTTELIGKTPPCLTDVAPDLLYDSCGH